MFLMANSNSAHPLFLLSSPSFDHLAAILQPVTRPIIPKIRLVHFHSYPYLLLEFQNIAAFLLWWEDSNNLHSSSLCQEVSPRLASSKLNLYAEAELSFVRRDGSSNSLRSDWSKIVTHLGS
jgi:hypothetical protein